MNVDDLKAEMEAAFAVEWARSALLHQLSILAGRAHVKSLWQIAWVTGHKAGLETAKNLHSAS